MKPVQKRDDQVTFVGTQTGALQTFFRCFLS